MVRQFGGGSRVQELQADQPRSRAGRKRLPAFVKAVSALTRPLSVLASDDIITDIDDERTRMLARESLDLLEQKIRGLEGARDRIRAALDAV